MRTGSMTSKLGSTRSPGCTPGSLGALLVTAARFGAKTADPQPSPSPGCVVAPSDGEVSAPGRLGGGAGSTTGAAGSGTGLASADGCVVAGVGAEAALACSMTSRRDGGGGGSEVVRTVWRGESELGTAAGAPTGGPTSRAGGGSGGRPRRGG